MSLRYELNKFFRKESNQIPDRSQQQLTDMSCVRHPSEIIQQVVASSLISGTLNGEIRWFREDDTWFARRGDVTLHLRDLRSRTNYIFLIVEYVCSFPEPSKSVIGYSSQHIHELVELLRCIETQPALHRGTKLYPSAEFALCGFCDGLSVAAHVGVTTVETA